MGFSIASLGLLGILWSCCLPGLVFGTEMFLDKFSGVHCGPRRMSFSLPLGFEEFASDIALLDDKDKARSLKNDSTCGLWIGWGKEETLLVIAAYDGCYVRREDEDFVMTVIVDRTINGEVDHRKRDIKCPFKPAMDAPSASDCAAIQTSDRLPCANNSVSGDVCESLGCCFTPPVSSRRGFFSRDIGSPCYFGKKVTAQCTGDGQIVVAISKDVTVPSLILDTAQAVNVDSSSCPQLAILKTSAFVSFQFPLSCGGQRVSGDDMVYENAFEATNTIMTWQGASITRDSALSLTVRCSFSQTAPAPLMVEVVTLPPPPPVSTTGPLSLEMRIATGALYTTYFQDGDYPLTKGLRDLVFLEVRILRRTDPNLVLILNNCWATPTSNPTHQMQWSILVNSCPYPDDAYLTQLSPVVGGVDFPNQYKRFIVSAFVFVDQDTQTAFSEEVYFHCSASVCIPSATDSCNPSCNSRRGRAVKKPLEQISVSKGPINFLSSERPQDVKVDVSIKKEMPINSLELWDLMLNETDAGFIGAKEGPMDGDLTDADKLLPRRVKDNTEEQSNFLMYLRGAAVGGGILLVAVTILGVWRCHRSQRPTMHTVKI